MNALKNKVQLIGYVGADPEIKVFGEGRKLSRFRLATNEVYKKENGDKIEDTQWHTIVAWGKQAELIEKFVTKGKEILIAGKLEHRTYVDSNGEKRVTSEVIVNDVLFIGNK